MAWREQLAVGDLTVEGTLIADPSQVHGLGGMSPRTYFVDRNVGASGDGLSWTKAYKTIGEAVAKVNDDYTNSSVNAIGRNREIIIGEGWYGEVGMTLTASDVRIISAAAGTGMGGRSVLYGSASAGGFDAGAVVPALRITGGNNSIIDLDFMNSASGLYPCIVEGTQGSSGPTGNLFYNLGFLRDVADAYTYAIEILGNEGAIIQGCMFSQSAKTAGVKIASNGVTNPVNNWVIDNRFVGTPIGIHQTAGHNTLIKFNDFFDASDDRPDTIDNPCVIAATSAFMYKNFAPQNTLAEFNGGAVGVELANICSDSAAANYPA